MKKLDEQTELELIAIGCVIVALICLSLLIWNLS